MEKICIVIPAYNEEKRIGKTLGAYSSYFEVLRKGKKLDYEILVVINNTKDGTEEIVKKYVQLNNRIRYLNLIRGGKGYAVIEGFKDALKRDNDLIGFVDADMATSPEKYFKLIKNVEKCDGVIASRGLKDSKVKTTLYRKLTNRGFNTLVRLLLHIQFKDTQCGAKLFKRKTIEELLKSQIMTQWAFDVDLLYKLKKVKIKEIATDWEDKTGSKVNLKDPLKMFSSVIRLRLIYSPFKFVVKVYDKLPERIKIHGL